MGKLIDITGQRFGHLLVVKFAQIGKRRQSMWLCICDCGEKKEISKNNLISGNTKSCGCSTYRKSRTHGMYLSKEYGVWSVMIQRCINPNVVVYELYGQRGIYVCDRWLKFENFYNDMGDRPSDNHSIDRINNDGNYEPDNCRWATATEQARNKRIRIDNSSGHKGIAWYDSRSKWRVRIGISKKCKTIGYFEKLIDAINARKNAELLYWGEAK